jgi:hypothetical protein
MMRHPQVSILGLRVLAGLAFAFGLMPFAAASVSATPVQPHLVSDAISSPDPLTMFPINGCLGVEAEVFGALHIVDMTQLDGTVRYHFNGHFAGQSTDGVDTPYILNLNEDFVFAPGDLREQSHQVIVSKGSGQNELVAFTFSPVSGYRAQVLCLGQ